MRVRTLEQVTADGDRRWFSAGIDLAHRLGSAESNQALDPARPVVVARAPARLDVMGGIADYSGSLVLEMPLACATSVVAQRQPGARLQVVSVRGGDSFRFEIDLDSVLQGELSAPGDLAAWFAARPGDRWASYIVGSVQRCLTLEPAGTTHGLAMHITSDVPEGKGVASSAALEVAVMSAAAACFDIPMDAISLATACQWAENHIAGAPCGIMDQMASTLGRRDRLLRLRCQPAVVDGHVTIPDGFRFFGIDSGIRHAVTGADYGTVRTAAFMGYRMIADWTGLSASVAGGIAQVHDARWGGYLANITPDELEGPLADRLPKRMEGAEFLARYGGITDTVTRVDPTRTYPVRAATFHPIFENERVTQFAALLDTGVASTENALALGNLMFGSHGSYSMCGLGSDGTDWFVSRVAELEESSGLYGAKITGGGSGGTVAILGRADAHDAVRRLAREYERDTGRSTVVFDGSGPGADELGALSLRVW